MTGGQIALLIALLFLAVAVSVAAWEEHQRRKAAERQQCEREMEDARDAALLMELLRANRAFLQCEHSSDMHGALMTIWHMQRTGETAEQALLAMREAMDADYSQPENRIGKAVKAKRKPIRVTVFSPRDSLADVSASGIAPPAPPLARIVDNSGPPCPKCGSSMRADKWVVGGRICIQRECRHTEGW